MSATPNVKTKAAKYTKDQSALDVLACKRLTYCISNPNKDNRVHLVE